MLYVNQLRRPIAISGITGMKTPALIVPSRSRTMLTAPAATEYHKKRVATVTS
jgi:hypothetical protein